MKRKICDFKNKNFAFLIYVGLAQMLIYEIRNGECPFAHMVF